MNALFSATRLNTNNNAKTNFNHCWLLVLLRGIFHAVSSSEQRNFQRYVVTH